MKILIATILLGVLGAGSYLYAKPAAATAAPGAPACGEATLTCTPQGTCKIECQDANGAACSVEIACDGATCRVVACDGPGDCKPSCQPNCTPVAPTVCPSGCK